MKRIKYVLLLLIALVVTGCRENHLTDCTMEIKEGTLTTKGATIVITDHSKKKNTYGEWYRMDKKKGKKWVELKPIVEEYAFNMIGYNMDENDQLVLEVNWEWLYGSLEPGTYRLVKEGPNNTTLTAEFKIE